MDSIKLGLLENFSTLISVLFSIVLVLILAGIALLFLAAAATWALTALVGSFIWAALIVAGVFIIAAVIVYVKREKLIVNPAVRMLSKIIFEKRENRNDYE